MTPPFVPSRRTAPLPPLPTVGSEPLPPLPTVARRPPSPDLPPLPSQLRPVKPFDLTLLSDLTSLELRARFVMDAFLAGLHRSPRKGSSVEFAEYRNYQFGDDLRRIDWRLFGRTDRLRVKQCEHETQMRVFLVLDTSGSMDYTSRPESILAKYDYARTALAALGLLAQRQGDAFGLAIVGAGLTDYLKPKASTAQWRSMLGKLDGIKVGGTTGLAKGLGELGELMPSRSLVVIASDFYGEGKELDQVLRRYHFDHHEVIALHILDPVEIDFDQDWDGTFIDAESSGRLVLESAAVRAGYLERFRAFLDRTSESIRREGGDYSLMRTDGNPAGALGYYMAERERLL